mgnify:FL=1
MSREITLNKIEKATLATALSIFEDHILDNVVSSKKEEISERDAVGSFVGLLTIETLRKKFELQEIMDEIESIKAD